MGNKKTGYETYAAEPMAEVPEMKDLFEQKIQELQDAEQAQKVAETKPYTIEKITRSCDRSISVNYQTYKVSTILSATVNKQNATQEELDAMSREIYAQAEKHTLEEIQKIAQTLGR